METVRDFIFLGPKITADGDCSHEIKRRLLLGRQVMTNLDSILKSKEITLPTKVCLVKAMVFPVVMYRCERWTIKKAECQRIDAFKLWCWSWSPSILVILCKQMTNLANMFKSRDITLLTKVHLVKAVFFPVVIYGSESWTIKKAECRRIDAFELWCWRRLLRVPWTEGDPTSPS